MLDWNELKSPEHASMFEDVRTMIAVRKQEASVLALPSANKEPHLMAVPCEQDIAVPVPYIRWNDRAAILVVANRNTTQDAHLKLRIPLKEMSMTGHANYKVTELWPGAKSKIYMEKDLGEFAITVQRDKTPGGGLRVIKIEPNS